MKIKLKTIQNTENESDDEEDKSIIKVEENRVYFHADVTRENCIKLIESLQKAQEYIAIRNIKNEFEEIGNIYLYIFSDGGELYAGLILQILFKIQKLISSPLLKDVLQALQQLSQWQEKKDISEKMLICLFTN